MRYSHVSVTLFGEPPKFATVMETLAALEREINAAPDQTTDVHLRAPSSRGNFRQRDVNPDPQPNVISPHHIATPDKVP
jgi:hypothetical protein